MSAPVPTLGIVAGSSLGKYEIVRKLATGGMAEIYLARMRGAAEFEKLVVLKCILPTVASDPSFVQMFLDEARLTATLQHPNIADVYDVGEATERTSSPWSTSTARTHARCGTRPRAATRRPPLAIALAIVRGIAAALDYAHDSEEQTVARSGSSIATSPPATS